MNGLDPRLLQKKLKKTTFNFSTAGQRLSTTMPVIDEVLSDNVVELAIVDIFFGTVRSLKSFEKKTLFFQYNTFDNMGFSLAKVHAHNKTYGLFELPNISPTIRRHNKWVDIVNGKELMLDQNADFNNGYFSRFFHRKDIWDKKIKSIRANKNRDVPIVTLNQNERDNIDKLLEKFKDYNVPVLLVSAPFFQDTLGERAKSHQQLIMKYVNEKQIPLVDFNELWDELDFQQSDFLDAGHVNTKGALKVSGYLASYVKENYKFTNRLIEKNELDTNRYAIIDNDYDEVIFKKSFSNIESNKNGGIRKVYFFRTYHNKYEILLEGDSIASTPMVLRYEYQYKTSEKNKINRAQRRFIKNNNQVAQRMKINNGLPYDGREFQVFQFNSVFDTALNFKLFLIKGKERIEILKFDELKLNNGNR
ncbi:MAG: hypothetical protein JKY22_11705 [Flavobacteriaceae bacterium]|nr:hypothetical protein [Flavobacteriaceae bacterium]